MADSPVTTTQLGGFFKEVYGDDIPDLVPRDLKLQEMIDFVPRQKENGNKYNQPVRLTDSSGMTFAGADAGAFSLNDAAALTTKNAQVSGSQIVFREQMDYETAARAANGRNAFKDATKYIFEGLQKSHRKILEVELMYGQVDLGIVSAYSSPTITITTATYAPGIWAGLEGATVEVFDTTLATNRGSGVISSVDLVNKTITLAAGITGTVATDRIFLKDQVEAGGTFASCAGLHKILSNTGSLFGISASSYSLWGASSYSAGSAALTQAKIGTAIAQAMGKGLMGDIALICNPKTWNNLMSDQAALVRNLGDMKKKVSKPEFQNGAEAVTLYHGNGSIEIKSHIMCKESFAYGIVKDDWIRPGSVDFSLKTPGMGDQIFFHLPTKAGFEVRSYSNQALFCVAPGRQFIITGIVNS